eukprot:scaffold511_cov83-Skeletonema_dohrnii-CCMP3373.AAC.3
MSTKYWAPKTLVPSASASALLRKTHPHLRLFHHTAYSCIENNLPKNCIHCIPELHHDSTAVACASNSINKEASDVSNQTFIIDSSQFTCAVV